MKSYVKPLIIVSFLSLFLGYIMLYQAENVSNSFNIFNEPEANAVSLFYLYSNACKNFFNTKLINI